jgi:hypothetical protein
LLGGNCHFSFVSCVRFIIATISRTVSWHEKFEAVLSNNANRLPISLKLCDLCNFEMCWIIYDHPVFSRKPLRDKP